MTEYAPDFGSYFSDTQRVVNNLPRWMNARRLNTSNAQAFFNIPARHLDHLFKQTDQYLYDQYLELSGVDEPDQLRRHTLPAHVPLESPTEIDNWILNSSFEICSSEDRLPDYWQSSGSGAASITTGIIGSKAVLLNPAPGQVSDVHQELRIELQAGQQFILQGWYSSNGTGLTPPGFGFGIEVVGYHVDATTETLYQGFAVDTGGWPRRILIRGSFAQRVTRLQVRAVNTSTVLIPTPPVTVDALLFDFGDVQKEWAPFALDHPYYITLPRTLNPFVLEQGIRLQYVEQMREFWTEAIPTRVGTPSLLSSGGIIDPTPTPGADGFTVYGSGGSFTEVDFWNKPWSGTWQVGYQGTVPGIRGLGDTAPDVWGPWDIGFLNWRNWFEDGHTWVPEAMTGFGSKLAVVLQKQDHLGQWKRFLLIVDPMQPRPFKSFLRVVAMIELPGIPVGTMISRAEFRRTDYQWLYVGNGESEWAYRLYYDYFMIDYSTKTIIVREDYGTLVPMLSKKFQLESGMALTGQARLFR